MIERLKERFPLVRPLLIPFILYIGLLTVSLRWIQLNPVSVWRYPVGLAPMLPGLWIAVGVVRATRRLDELAQKILMEGIAISFALTLILTISLGLLGMAGLEQPNAIYISLFMMLVWLVAKLLRSQKYQ